MRIIADNKIIRDLVIDPETRLANPVFQIPEAEIQFEWPSLLEYIGLGTIYSELPPFDHTHKLFDVIVETLTKHDEEGVVFHIYDHLFAENLREISSLQQIKTPYILEAIERQRKMPSYHAASQFISKTLDEYEKRFREDAPNTIHDLILYLGWDRMCASVSYLFNHQSDKPKFIEGIKGIGDCLIESYQHISSHGRTAPGASRMIETLFYYEMREEVMHLHSEPIWEMLSKSFPGLKSPEALIDFLYIDNAVIPFEKYADDEYVTLDSPEIVLARLNLANYILPRLNYSLSPKKIHFLE